MSISISQIEHHQRILITGDRRDEILAMCQQVLDFHNRSYDVISSSSEKISDGPMVLIAKNDDLLSLQPHIALVDKVTDDNKKAFTDLANSIPKSGTLVYNESDELAKEICGEKRTDVHLEPFKGDIAGAVKSLLKRVGINESRFNEAQ